jgi:acetyl-CoA synthetase
MTMTADVWIPSPERIQRANVTSLMRELKIADVPALHRWSVDHVDDFVGRSIARLDIRFRTPPTKIIDMSDGPKTPPWFPGAKLNIVESCFNSAPDADAIVFSRSDGSIARWSYRELRALANRVSNGLLAAGMSAGDAIAVFMPMTPRSVAIYLGIVQAGCVVVSIADSFAAPEIATRLRIAGAKAIFSASYVTRSAKRSNLFDRVRAAGAPRAIVMPEADGKAVDVELRADDVAWDEFLAANDSFEALPCDPHDTINVLFSSGTTGDPKAIPFDHTSPLKCAIDGYYHQDLHPGDIVAWPTSLGWMMGPWLVFATLINRGTIALHHDAPLDRVFGQFVQDARVNMLGVIPSIVRRWRETRCIEGLDWSRIDTFSSTGECSNSDDMRYLMNLAGGKPVIEYCGGTEIGGGFITSTVVQPNVPAAFSTPALGSDLVILDDAARPSDSGELFLIPPAIGLSRRLLNADHERVYFANAPRGPKGEILRRHGDQMQRMPNGYYRAMGRADDTMNLGGIKVSSAEIERAVIDVTGVKESAAIAINPIGGGPSLLVLFVVASDETKPPSREELRPKLQQAIREKLNPLFKIYDVVIVPALPRTATQKVMRRELRAAYVPARA